MPSPSPLPFNCYKTLEALAKNLRCHPETFSRSRELQLHKIPKKRNPKAFREVWEIKDLVVKDLLRTFNSAYLDFLKYHLKEFPLDCVHGFVDKRSILTNAKAHSGKKLLLKADIKNFFESIRIEKLEDHFREMNIDPEISKVLSNMLTKDGKLPQGFCTSPLFSNLIFLPLDKELILLASKYNCTYTRYADDITFSSNVSLPSYSDLEKILSKGEFELDRKKYLLRKNGQSFYVTGLSISGTEPRVPKKWKHNLRQEIYFIKKYGLFEHVGKRNYSSIQNCINVIDGKIRFLKSIEPQLADEARINFNSILKKENRKIIYPHTEKNSQKYEIFIDECVIHGRLYLCGVLVEDVTSLEDSLRKLHEELRQDSFLPGKHGALDNEIFHWVDSSDSIRIKIIDLLKKLPFRAYINCEKFTGNYKNEYKKLFLNLLKSQFINLDNQDVRFLVEINNTVSEQALQNISDDLYKECERLDSRRPFSKPIVKMLGKTSYALCLPDCILGVLKKYLSLESNKIKSDEYLLYETFFDIIKPKLKTICVFKEQNKILWFKSKNGFIDDGVDFRDLLKEEKLNILENKE